MISLFNPSIFLLRFSILSIFLLFHSSFGGQNYCCYLLKLSRRLLLGKNYSGTWKELEMMKESLERRKQSKAKLSDLKTPYILKPFLMSLGLMFFQQFCGVNAVLFNLDLIFQVGILVTYFLFTFFWIVSLEKMVKIYFCFRIERVNVG